MECKGYIKDINLKDNKVLINLETENKTILDELEKLFNSQKQMKIEIKKYRKKRSLDANAYFWVMVDRLSDYSNVGRLETYRKYIKEGGVMQIIPIKTECVDKWISIWEEKGDGWFCETMTSKLPGYTNIKTYFGSSSYDSKEMARIIDLAIQDCRAAGIETLSDQEIIGLLEEWEKN